METLKLSRPSLFNALTSAKNKSAEAINNFGICFKGINDDLLVANQSQSQNKKFLIGASPQWQDIVNNLDAPRDITVTFIQEVKLAIQEKHCSLFSIIGSAGSGKSTVLKRISLELSKLGFPVYFNYSEAIPKPEDIKDALNEFNRKCILVFDNAELVVYKLPQILEALEHCNYKPVIIISCRSIYLDFLNGDQDCIKQMRKYNLNILSDNEIYRVIDILTIHDLLGTLKNKSQAHKFKEFKDRSKSQLLVAMKEATTGKRFDDIIIDEYKKIVPTEAQFAVLCVAITTEAGFAISKQEYVGFALTEPNTALNFLDNTLRDIILTLGHNQERLIIRHRVIAEIILKNCDLDELKRAYLNVLTNLAHEINHYDFYSPKFNLYKNIINHKKIYKRFENNIQLARDIYESLKHYFRDDYQFWLQFGSLELEGKGGDLELAENYLSQAWALKNDHPIIRNTLCYFYFKKAQKVNTLNEAIECKEKGIELGSKISSNNLHNKIATYSILYLGRYNWAMRWSNYKEDLISELEEILEKIREGNKLYPNIKHLMSLESSFNGALIKCRIGLELDAIPENPYDLIF
ncbi:MAG: hypothetical protein IPP71_10120 [Bacteroidetes bacterium]|nr:hypothetical protein [Bacteroidota bacterium]